MKKKIPELLASYDLLMKDSLAKRGLTYLGSSSNPISKSYLQAVDSIEKDII
jgi:hypothetical protein